MRNARAAASWVVLVHCAGSCQVNSLEVVLSIGFLSTGVSLFMPILCCVSLGQEDTVEHFVTLGAVLPGPASVLHLVSFRTLHGVNVRSSQNRTGPEEWAQNFPKTIVCILS